MSYRPESGDGVASGEFALHCRGDVRLFCGDADCTPRSKKGRALLAILAAEQRPLSRTKIIDLLWSDRQEEQARASLRTLLADMRQEFNCRFDDLLLVDRERIGLGAAVRTDLTDPTLARPAGELFEGLDHIDPELDEWLRVEREKWAKLASGPQSPVTGRPPARMGRELSWGWLAVLLLAVGAAALLYLKPWAEPPQPMVAVLRFTDLTGKNQLLADGLAEQMRLELAQQPNVRVIGAQSSQADQILKADLPTAARLLRATHVVEGALVSHEGQLQLSIRLTDGSTGKPIWSAHVPASGAVLATGPDPLVQRVAIAMGELAARTAPSEAMAASPEAYLAVFQARAWMRTYDTDEQMKARELMYRVVSRYPNFVPALITLAESTIAVSDAPGMRGPIPIAQARAEAINYASRAIKLAPSYGPAYSGMGSVYFQMDEGIPYDRKAAQLSSGSGSAHLNWALALARKGNWTEALKEHRLAAELDPLNLTAQYYYALALAQAGETDASRAALNSYFGRAVPRMTRLQVIAAAESIFLGDVSRAFVAARLALREDPSDAWARDNAMTTSRMLFGREAAKPFADPNSSISALITHDDTVPLIKRIDAMGKEFWYSDYEIAVSGHHLLSKGRGDVLLAAYDRALKAGTPRQNDLFAQEELVIALKQAGRRAEATYVLQRCQQLQNRQKGASRKRTSYDRALIHALAGENSEAIRELRNAVGTQAWLSSNIVDHPLNHLAFDGIRRTPEFKAIVRDFDAWIAQERQQAIKEMTAVGLRAPPRTLPVPARLS